MGGLVAGADLSRRSISRQYPDHVFRHFQYTGSLSVSSARVFLCVVCSMFCSIFWFLYCNFFFVKCTGSGFSKSTAMGTLNSLPHRPTTKMYIGFCTRMHQNSDKVTVNQSCVPQRDTNLDKPVKHVRKPRPVSVFCSYHKKDNKRNL